MHKQAFVQLFFNALMLAIVASTSIFTAKFLGPSEYGQYAGLQSIVAILTPFTTLRIETRVASCESLKQLAYILSAVVTSAIIFVGIGCLMSFLISSYVEWIITVSVVLLTATSAILEALMSCYAYIGNSRALIKSRALRQLTPAVFVTAAAFYFGNIHFVFFALVLSSLICMVILIAPIKSLFKPSLRIFRRILQKNASGLKASILLAILNTIWLNGLLPLMNMMGLSSLAGQYAIIQRILNSLYGVIAITFQSIILKSDNRLHQEGLGIIVKAFVLFCVGALLTMLLYWSIYIQTIFSISDAWKLERILFLAICFFLTCSFAVGSVSIVGIRLKDEWFMANWQAIFMVVWVGIILTYDIRTSFVYMLLVGGMAYWILLVRWTILSKKYYG